MSLLTILQYPDPRLKRIGLKVENFDAAFQKVVDDMFETRYTTPQCAALAATQLDLNPAWSVTVIDLSEKGDEPLCLVNPIIIHTEGEHIETEGCMSVYPKFIHEKVKRAKKITVQAQDRYGQPLEITAEGYLAQCIQHEVDHLLGRIFVDKLPSFKVEKIKRKIKKYHRHFKEN